MMHGPCGHKNPSNPCMKGGKCKNHYLKEFSEYTTQNEDGYPSYRRRKNENQAKVRGRMLNRCVVPYNPYLLSLFHCHMNVKICSRIKSVMYLYKYVYKGLDKVSYRITNDLSHDEIK